MKLKNKTILDFAGLSFGDKHFPVKIAFAIAVNAEAIESALKAYNKQRAELIEKSVRKDENGDFMIREDGSYDIIDIETWNRDIKELLEAEAEVNITTITMDDLKKCDEGEFDSLSVAEVSLMRFMVEC